MLFLFICAHGMPGVAQKSQPAMKGVQPQTSAQSRLSVLTDSVCGAHSMVKDQVAVQSNLPAALLPQ